MPTSQFLAPGRFPAGTVLGVYKASGDPTRQPAGATVATPTMTATGVTVAGLEAHTAYVAGAVVGGRWTASAFTTDGEVGIDAGDIGANAGDVTGQIKLTRLTNGKAFLQFGTAGVDATDMAGFWLEDAGTLKTNSFISANSGITTPALDFGEGTSISGDGASFVTSAGLKVTGPVGFNGSGPLAKPTITGSRATATPLAQLLTALASYGMITNNTTA